MPEGTYYRHSGNFSVQGAIIGVIAGMAVGLPVAYLYSYLVLYIPLVGYITFIFSAGFGGIVGAVTMQALKWRKVRNVAVAMAATTVSALAAFYTSWAVWIYALLRRANVDAQLLPLLLQPQALWEMIVRVNGVGAYNVRGWTPTGLALWGFWSLEALLILGVALFVALKMIREEPYCETCNLWCKGSEGVALIAAGDAGELKQRLEMKDFGVLEKLGAVPPGATEWNRLDLHVCPLCKMTSTLTVNAVTRKVDKEGKASEDADEIVEKLWIGPGELETIRKLGEKVAGAMAPSAGGSAPAASA